ncbi:HAD family hydrolase [Amnibacterium sp.]|uniref:HAD family hydrolase n=1 Tax=Amnibacterium sp. TaxID=1872496 RepID=UPI0026369F67|nr:HAD family hydrolase [Amnibacterium sp.]MCU1472912.1 family hydrolase [Amnibacterium sp.]
MPDPRYAAVLFDIDGTLVDSNYLHVDAWARALEEVGHPVPAWRIHRAIGMDSAKLMEILLGDDLERLGDEAKERHSTHYRRDAERLRSFDRAQELLRELAGRGMKVVLATSAPQEEFEVLQKVLQVDDAIAEYTTSEDVSTAKPAPDVVQMALKKAGVGPDQALMVGDAAWDMQAAKKAGVASIGVRTGGIGPGELEDAGAVAVYDDVAQLLSELDASPLYRG